MVDPSTILTLSILLAVAPGVQPDSASGRIRRLEESTVQLSMGRHEAPLQLGLRKLMELYRVPGLSVAVIDNYEIVWAKGYGVVEPGSKNPVTPGTLFQAGSISKPVAAAGALALVEQGRLALDEDVNRKLKTWKLPENEFTKTEKVTLRRLMSHTAGLTVHGFPGYDVDAPLPMLVQILDGRAPANTPAIRVDIVPGTKERYSGGGITIEQQLMMDVTGKPFPALMRELVLDRIGMADSSYEQPLPPALAARTAGGARADGTPVHGRWHLYPEMAAAGLWTNPTDLAKFVVEIALSKRGRSNRVLSEKMTREMLTPVIAASGLGFFLDKDKPGQFGHGGADEGFQALLTMNADSGQGAVVMADSDNGASVGEFVIAGIAREYGWKHPVEPNAFATLALIARVRGAGAALDRYTEFQNSGQDKYKVEEWTLNALGYQLLRAGRRQDAIAVFQRNVREYPKSSNVYDSLGEAYAAAGQKDLALENYRKALALDPQSRSAAEAIRNLTKD